MIEQRRRDFLKAGFFLGLWGWLTQAKAGDYASKLHPTPSEILGPFYPKAPFIPLFFRRIGILISPPSKAEQGPPWERSSTLKAP
jgi:hypothetical protein